MALTDEQRWQIFERSGLGKFFLRDSTMEFEYERSVGKFARAIESAATAPLLERIAHLEATASANYGRGQADAHSMLSERIAELERELEEARKDAERWAHACKGNNKQINVCSWDGDAYEFVGYAMKKEAIDAIADEEIAAMQKGKT